MSATPRDDDDVAPTSFDKEVALIFLSTEAVSVAAVATADVVSCFSGKANWS